MAGEGELGLSVPARLAFGFGNTDPVLPIMNSNAPHSLTSTESSWSDTAVRALVRVDGG